MAKTSSYLDIPLRDELQRLAQFQPQGLPVVSLYLNLRPDQHGRDSFAQFYRKAFAERLKAFPEHSAERASFERDIERINGYLENELTPDSNGLAIFACSGAGEFFEAVQLDAPVGEHWLFVGAVPHIYPLVRLVDQYPRYAAVMLDTNRARILVFALGAIEKQAQVEGVKTRRTAMGGWSQARYQRHVDNFHMHHVKEVVETLDRIVTADNIQQIVIAGDEVAVPLLKEHMPAHLADKIVDVMKLDRHAADRDLVATTLEALRQKDSETDRDRVAEVIDAWQAGGLGVVGPEATLRALQMGQVDELLISGNPLVLKPVQRLPDDAAPALVATDTSAAGGPDVERLHLSDELVTRAQQTGARVRIIEDPALLKAHGGVSALLRFRL
jgi:peptide chain release factor subunit 1